MARRILIIKMSSIGDVVHALPAAKSLRLGFPDAYLCWAVHRSCRDVVEGNRYLDETYVIHDKSLAGIIRAGRDLKQRGFNTAIDMQGLFRSSLLAWLSGAPERIGFSGNQELHSLFINRPAVRPGYLRPAPYCQMEFAVAAGAPRIEPIPEIYIGPEHRREAAELLAPALDSGGPIVVMSPGSAWATKRWLPGRFAQVGDRLASEHGCQIVIIGGAGDPEAAEAIMRDMAAKSLSLAGRTSLKALAAVFERTALYLGGDSGPMHIAAAMGTPVLAIFGPTDPERTGPVGTRCQVVRHAVPCGPCRCRECSHHTCMMLVTVDEVVQAAGNLLPTDKTAGDRGHREEGDLPAGSGPVGP